MKIIYLSTSKLPTDKAYGVTVLETWKAARRLGIDLDIHSTGKKEFLKNLGICQISRIGMPRHTYSRNLRIVSRLIFNINSILIPVLAMLNINFRRCRFIWTRDLKSALVLKFLKGNDQLLVEIHHLPTKVDLRILKYLSKFKSVNFSAVSTKLQKELVENTGRDQIIVSPMAVPDSFFMTYATKPIRNPIRMIYLGKGESSGHSNGLNLLATDFAKALQFTSDIQIHFVGLEPQYQALINNEMVSLGVNENRFSFIEHVPHAEVPTLLSTYDVGLLPYPASIYNNERFPIKSLEYAASGLVILASDIDSHREIITEGRSFFYRPGYRHSFAEAILQISENPEMVLSKKLLARKWAEDHSYDSRIRGIVEKWLGAD